MDRVDVGGSPFDRGCGEPVSDVRTQVCGYDTVKSNNKDAIAVTPETIGVKKSLDAADQTECLARSGPSFNPDHVRVQVYQRQKFLAAHTEVPWGGAIKVFVHGNRPRARSQVPPLGGGH